MATKTEDGWVPYDKLTKRQLITLAIALEDQRDRAIRALPSSGDSADLVDELKQVRITLARTNSWVERETVSRAVAILSPKEDHHE